MSITPIESIHRGRILAMHASGSTLREIGEAIGFSQFRWGRITDEIKYCITGADDWVIWDIRESYAAACGRHREGSPHKGYSRIAEKFGDVHFGKRFSFWDVKAIGRRELYGHIRERNEHFSGPELVEAFRLHRLGLRPIAIAHRLRGSRRYGEHRETLHLALEGILRGQRGYNVIRGD